MVFVFHVITLYIKCAVVLSGGGSEMRHHYIGLILQLYQVGCSRVGGVGWMVHGWMVWTIKGKVLCNCDHLELKQTQVDNLNLQLSQHFPDFMWGVSYWFLQVIHLIHLVVAVVGVSAFTFQLVPCWGITVKAQVHRWLQKSGLHLIEPPIPPAHNVPRHLNTGPV